ncbi:hypothetical protein M2459_002038 [Parabacteroides sp. PF5-5]|uniref:hypothetical protein n=1 Tax=unclassified Parabacteroides TaxID=2649774 RepID=UPI0024750D44|nr:MULTISPECIES: hypothetical protein [unclassified Parabacteroides]MDH6305569.1 hypothetical protein [Parabacteroides sp. PH5-39]MDH6316391.1 hypothetical protein [Parabacteroides sp. PF5-13]MDH6319876.1 hypothetical protein [Parabacteroides sp. PH5-13]MDH6323533.1 hypothetical protein [Parabacteroides sp. PH5-8]MDH6327578.1 hypothetical protein [Parabacteroides sp. PH5-41]
MKIIYHKQVVKYLNELVDVLYEQDYFGFKESAYDYVDWILDRVSKNIGTMPPKAAPEYFSKYGENLSYIRLKRNTQTTWYVFFNQENDLFHIRYISNNHIIAQYL